MLHSHIPILKPLDIRILLPRLLRLFHLLVLGNGLCFHFLVVVCLSEICERYSIFHCLFLMILFYILFLLFLYGSHIYPTLLHRRRLYSGVSPFGYCNILRNILHFYLCFFCVFLLLLHCMHHLLYFPFFFLYSLSFFWIMCHNPFYLCENYSIMTLIVSLNLCHFTILFDFILSLCYYYIYFLGVFCG